MDGESQKISARYTVLGTIDGVVGSLATVMALSAAEASSALIVTAGISVGVGLGLSNGFGGFMAERTVEQMKLRKIEEAMLRKRGWLTKTRIGKDVWKKLVIDAFTHGGFSFLGSVIPVLPFLFSPSLFLATILSFLLGTITLFLLGMYSGYVAKENMIYTGLMMLIVGILVTIITRALETWH